MRLLVRADGDGLIGTGHVMRMLALTEAARRAGHEAAIASARLDDRLAARVARAGTPLLRLAATPGSDDDAAATKDALASGFDRLILDGYVFGARFQEAVHSGGVPTLVVDDYGHAEIYSAELLLNQNVSASAALYENRAPDARLLLGPRYALLRDEVARAEPRPEAEGFGRRILVTMGGADPTNATEAVLDALGWIDDLDLQIRALVGPANPHGDRLSAKAGPQVTLLGPQDAMADLLKWADLAVTAAGTTTYELCRLGVPMLLVVLAENQGPPAEAFAREGIAEHLGWHPNLDPEGVAAAVRRLLVDPARRREMQALGRARVDGRGADRVLRALEEPR